MFFFFILANNPSAQSSTPWKKKIKIPINLKSLSAKAIKQAAIKTKNELKIVKKFGDMNVFCKTKTITELISINNFDFMLE